MAGPERPSAPAAVKNYASVAAAPSSASKTTAKLQPSSGTGGSVTMLPVTDAARKPSPQHHHHHQQQQNVARLSFLAGMLVGLPVVVETEDGTVYEGVYHSSRFTSGGISVVLYMAQKHGIPAAKPAELTMIDAADVVQVSCAAFDFEFSESETISGDTTLMPGFQVDAAISRHGGTQQPRDLQRWSSDSATTGADHLYTGRQSTDSTANWDQFATNEKLFGVTTDFTEDLYTTKLDKSALDYAQREREAARLARQIEQSATDNVHIAEERGNFVDDSQMDEEDRYGSVVRDANVYVPPALRQEAARNLAGKETTEMRSKSSKQNVPATEEPVDSHLISSVPSKDQRADNENVQKPALGPTSENSTLKSESPPAKLTLNPRAPSFKLNVSAVEFTPVVPASAPKNVFNKSLKFGSKSVREVMTEKLIPSATVGDADRGIQWPYNGVPSSYTDVYLDGMSVGGYGTAYDHGFPVPADPMQMQYLQYAPAMPFSPDRGPRQLMMPQMPAYSYGQYGNQ